MVGFGGEGKPEHYCGILACDLIWRAINSLYIDPDPDDGHSPTVLWHLVTKMFACGSTKAKDLCTEFGFDPDRSVRHPAHYVTDNYGCCPVCEASE